MSATTATGYPLARLRAAGMFLRQWTVNRYGAERVRDTLHSTLGVPHYRPAFNDGTDYRDAMKPLVDHVIARARAHAASSEKYVDKRPVIHALREVKRNRP